MRDYTGLSAQNAKELLRLHGPNELPDKQNLTILKLLFSQFNNPLVFLLIIGSLISYFAGEKIDAFLILIILGLNTILGFWQEFKASKELSALKKLEIEKARVLRDGKELEIEAKNLVPGDIVFIEQGEKIPADAKILESFKFSVNESSLTGESVPVFKSQDSNDAQVFFGTVAVSGRAIVQISATGPKTRFGTIAIKLTDIEEDKSPLEKNLLDFSKKVSIIAILASVVIFATRTLQGFELFEVFFTATALMVAAVPEGFPTVVTLALALGVRRMYKKKTLIRKMNAIEGLGATTLICSDKTGTLTKNEMRVKEVIVNSNEAELLDCAVYCNSASLVLKENHGSFDILGDTTEGALLLYASGRGVDINTKKQEGQIIDEIPFELKRRMMSVLWDGKTKAIVYSKGAPEVILPLCILDNAKKEEVIKKYEELAGKGLRVLAFASSVQPKNQKRITESEMNFLGLIGIADSPRTEAVETIRRARRAGIKIVMVTGDNELTAKAIAEEIGLLKEGDEILTGAQMDELSDEEFSQMINKIAVFARVIPEQKLKIIQSYQSLGEVVAVTGDGVNDALALKQAEIGIAMGKMGTDVAKEASDIVILDDNLQTIVSAIEEGRLIYANILKVVKFLMAGNLSEILVIAAAVVLGLPTPLLPVQILWINFVTDGFPALALTADSPSARIMLSPPRNKTDNLLNKNTLNFILISGVIMAVLTLVVFYIFLSVGSLNQARSYAFTVLVIYQMALIFVMRQHHSIFSNKYLFFAVILVIGLQFLIMYYPPLQNLFKIESGF